MKNIFKFLYYKQALVQSCFFCVAALLNIGSDRYWYFQAASAGLLALQLIADRLGEIADTLKNREVEP